MFCGRLACMGLGVDEGRKRVLGIMAAILASRKLAQQDSEAIPGLELCDSGRDSFCRADHAGD